MHFIFFCNQKCKVNIFLAEVDSVLGSNQDHSLMQGVEVIDRLLLGHDETTFNFPSIVNSTKTKN